jgi:hypothetical protein
MVRLGEPSAGAQRLADVPQCVYGADSAGLEEHTHNYTAVELASFSKGLDLGVGYACVLREFGSGVEVTGQRIDNAQDWRRLAKGPPRAAGERSEDPDRPRSDSSVSRTRTEFRRRCLAGGFDHLLTCTKRGKFESRDAAWGAWAVFERRFRRLLGPYACVVESHKEGGYHLHVAVRGFRPIGGLQRGWVLALGGTGREVAAAVPGNVDVVYRRSHTVRGLAGYLAKYLTKDTDAQSGRKLFSTSKGLLPLRVRRLFVPVSLVDMPQFSIRAYLHLHYGMFFESTSIWHYGGVVGFTCWAEGSGDD